MMKKVRFRTLGCYPLSGAVESEAETLDAIDSRDAADPHQRAPGPRDRPRPAPRRWSEEEAGRLLLSPAKRPPALQPRAGAESAGEPPEEPAPRKTTIDTRSWRPRIRRPNPSTNTQMAHVSDLIATDIAAYLQAAPAQEPAALHHLRLGRRRQEHADRPAALRVEDALRRPARQRSRPTRRSGARRAATSTSRCWSTACRPSASRASPSTWPTATSAPTGASSSSPTRPGHEQYTRNMVTGRLVRPTWPWSWSMPARAC